ncbi:MAG: hypothetical protein H7173_01800 [Rhodoferax sp.]|nr:hypothetical protein [Pseudorhodobacter sp.]
MTWTETGGPTVAAPTRRGFVSNLIERALALETGGRATIFYEPSGVVCDIILPKSSLVDLGITPVVGLITADTEDAVAPMPETPRLLVVEDSFLVILTIEGMCEDLGWEIVGPATRVEEAIALAQSEMFDAALLDVNLDGEMSWPIADVLKARGIPFAFSTGYNQSDILPDHLKDSAIVAKPYRVDELERRLRQMMSKRAEVK